MYDLERLVKRYLPWFEKKLEPYHVYTTEYDVEIRAQELQDLFGDGKTLSREIDAAWDKLQVEILQWKAEFTTTAPDISERIRRTLSDEELQDTCVTLLVDHSGSMRGEKILIAAAAADIAADFLSNLGVRFEILGFTTVSWHGGKSRKKWKRHWRPRNPGRLCDLLHVIYRTGAIAEFW